MTAASAASATLGLVDDRDVVPAGPADPVGGEVEPAGVADLRRPRLARGAQRERLDAVPLRGGRVAAGGGRIRHDRVRVQPLLVVEVDAPGAVRRPPVQEVQCPQRRGEPVARSRNPAQVVVGLGEPVAEAGGEHRGHVGVVEPGIGRVRGAPGLRPGRAAVDPFGRQHVADGLPGAGLPRPAAYVVVLRDVGDPAGVPFVGREPLRPGHAPVRVGSPGHRAVGAGVRAGQRGPRRRLPDRVGEVVPAGQVRRVRAARHPGDLLADRQVERMAVVGVERVPVRLVPDRETGQLLPVAAPDVPGGPGIGRFQVRDRRRDRVEQAQRVDDPDPGRGGEREQVVDPGEAVAAGARRNALVHRATADPEVTQAQIPGEGDQ